MFSQNKSSTPGNYSCFANVMRCIMLLADILLADEWIELSPAPE